MALRFQLDDRSVEHRNGFVPIAMEDYSLAEKAGSERDKVLMGESGAGLANIVFAVRVPG